MQNSFVKFADDGNIATLWNPEVSDDYAKDCEKGRDYADELVEAMRQGENQALLGWVVRSFGQNEARKGVEVGFCQRIAEWALSS